MRSAAAYVLVVLALIGGSFGYAHHQAVAGANRDRHVFSEVCERNNIFKAVVRNGETERLRLVGQLSSTKSKSYRNTQKTVVTVNRLMTILNCPATFDKSGSAVPLKHEEELKYLDLIARGWVPEVSDGTVVGHHRAETAGHRDF